MHRLPLLRLNGRARRAELLPPAAHVERDLVESVLPAVGIARRQLVPPRRQTHRAQDVCTKPAVASRLDHREAFP